MKRRRAGRDRYSWVKWDFRGEHKFVCESCGAVLLFTRILPQPIEIVVGLARVFEIYHRRCQDPRPARRGLLAVLTARGAAPLLVVAAAQTKSGGPHVE